ncbi:Lrp/AsnC family transcriptional regulator [Maliponia aquimaris]|uniref:Leucine-responsive regulatory protein n=1 Tax=Maliponia aquimaris TaxID=1673631 RepID=A0A238L5D7_9RHOB|nr:Lrp/AsnC family transcriptional regulator [Maliponia aquimaris]SMX49546.1 Leucine-responsive regulatory protein [Maliponia aquimaris]
MQDSRTQIDSADAALLEALQRDGQATAQDLGTALNLSPSQAGRRRQRLEESGVIKGYRAQLDPEQLGLDVQAFVQVQLARHGAQEGAEFTRLLRIRPEIVSAWTMTGEADYLLRVYCPDLRALNRLIHEVLLAHPVVSRVHSQIVMDQPKADAPLPIR